MRLNPQPQRATVRRILGVSLAPVLALGAVTVAGVGAAPAAAAAPNAVTPSGVAGPWSTPVALTGTTDVVDVVDVKTRGNGDVVAVYYREIAGTWNHELRVAVRPANSGTWGAATVLDTMDKGRESVQLLPTPDGSVTLTWVRPGDSRTIRMSTLAAGGTTWSAPADVVTGGGNVRDAFLAVGPSGRAALVWSRYVDRSTDVYVSERTTAGGSWSPAHQLDASTAESFGDAPQAFFAADGTLTVVWTEGDVNGSAAMIAEKAADATQWTAPRSVSGSATSIGRVRAGTGPDGTAVLTWNRSVGNDQAMEAVVRPAGSAQWGAVEKIGPANGAVETQPLVAPNGEITLVWVDSSGETGYGTRTTTRSTGGAWSPLQTLSTQYVPEQFDAEIGPDGTVHAGWVQEATPANDGGRIFQHAARVNGAWTTPKTLSRKPSGVAIGQVAGGPEGRTTAVWHESTGDFTGQLWTAGTGLPGSEPSVTPAVRRDHVGDDAFVDVFAQTSAGALTVYRGNATHVYNAKVQGGTWPTTSTLVPYGDLDGDGANEVLVRDGSGGLKAYRPARGAVVTPNSPSVTVGSGWGGFDALVASGDFTKDGRPDLVARDAASGDMYLFAATDKGGLARVGRIGTNWKALTVVGAGDLNADGHADLLARDAAGALWRYDGTGAGTIRAGVKIGSGWGGFTAIVGAGDLTKDGKDDVVGRNAAGELWRYDGTGAGTVRNGVKIGTGWNGFSKVF
ncbi:FG-GAP-like repeat-containing protein [Streptomyces sp. NPDC020412]|uniref:FG-GAP-like repeat-containing protein n=1 Tax=Streptomyces sp. NPDC020412 TaxID=3365073 RepID=UPI0037BA5DF8